MTRGMTEPVSPNRLRWWLGFAGFAAVAGTSSERSIEPDGFKCAMLGFGNVLDDEQIAAVLAYIESGRRACVRAGQPINDDVPPAVEGAAGPRFLQCAHPYRK